MSTGSHALGGGIDVLALECHWIADWMTTTSTHETESWQQDQWGMKWVCTLPCQDFYNVSSSTLMQNTLTQS